MGRVPGAAAADGADCPATLGEAWRWARRKVDTVDARVLLREACKCADGRWVSHGETVLEAGQRARLVDWVARRVAGEPVAYLLGWREFHGHRFAVTPDVLIPRPDTETLVDAALALLPDGKAARVLDLGTGSGCVAISIALARPRAEVVGVDASSAALRVAQSNAEALGASNVRFVVSDWYAAVEGRFDLIVSNPPYIAAADPHLGEGDLRFEPGGALSPGGDGLDALRAIIAGAPERLVPGGWLLVEHGWDQGAAVAGLLVEAGFEDRVGYRDLGGNHRVSGGKYFTSGSLANRPRLFPHDIRIARAL
ncbi:MAG: peptide chain release factor N(5)-glutamine methyltransferase [Rhodocyclaceae bacterium]|nr:peptide chain release factor N(5)-glutamine methyltransferase [Rhodocyclaceae bacterium]